MRRRLLASILLSSFSSLHANELETISVSQSASALDSEPVGLSSQITAYEVADINTADSEDVIKYQPNLMVRKRFIGDRNGLLTFRDMHNFQTPRALVYSDGLLLSNFLGANFGTAPRWDVVQPREIDRVEILYGPYSARYSGNSLGGVTVFHTTMPSQPMAHLSAGTFLQEFDDYGTDESYLGHRLNAVVGNRKGDWSLLLAASRLENESHPQSFGLTRGPGANPGTPVTGAFPYSQGGYLYNAASGSEVTEQNLKLKLGYDLTRDLQARLTLAWLDRRDETLKPQTYLRDANGSLIYNGDVTINGEDFAVTSQRLGLSESQDLITVLELDGKLGNGWDIQTGVSDYRVLDDTSRRSGTDFAVAKAGGPGTFSDDQGTGWQTFDLNLGHRHDGGWLGQRVAFGYHIDRYRLDEINYDTNEWRTTEGRTLKSASQGETRTQALFIENQWALNDKLDLTLGGRQEWWQASDGRLVQNGASAAYPQRNEQAFSPKASLSYRPTDDWLTSLSLGKAHRFATVGELYQGSLDNNGDFNAAFDPNLKTEVGLSKNLMVKHFFPAATVTVNLWENDVDDAIFRQTNVFTGVNNFQNIDRVRSRGIEFIANWPDLWVEGLTVDFNVSYTRAIIEENAAQPASEGKQFPRVPRWRANLLARYQATQKLNLSSGLRYASDPYDSLDNSDGDAEGFGFTDDYLVLDVRGRYQLDNHISVALGMDNVTDHRYYVFHPYPGRTLFAEVNWDY